MKLDLNARGALSLLNGFCCVYKPKDVSLTALKKFLISTICEQGNEADDSFVPFIGMPIVKPHAKSQALVVVGIKKQRDYSLHPLMAGKLFRSEDMRIEELDYLEPSSSGVCLFGLNNGCDELEAIRNRAWTKEYVLHGELGRETHEHKIRGQVVAKAACDHVRRSHFSKLLSKLRMQYKRVSFEFSNVDMQSQDAFELARLGTPRPKVLGSPVVYNVALKSFRTPNFYLSMHVTGENDYFLRSFVHEIGCSLGTLASTRRLRRAAQGPFTSDHALLDKHFNLSSIIKNVQMCNRIVKMSESSHSDVVQIKSMGQLESKALVDTFQLRDHEELPEPEDCLRIPWGRSYD